MGYEDLTFVGNIPETFSNDLLAELLGLFGEVKDIKRTRSLRGTNPSWVFVGYYEPASAETLRRILPDVDLGVGKLVIHPAAEGMGVDVKQDKVMDMVNEVVVRHRQELERTDVLDNFVLSYSLLHRDDSRMFSSTLKRWLREESEIRRRCRRMEMKTERERRRQAELEYLSRYDDDRSNDLFYVDRAAWMAGRSRNKR